VLPRLLVLLFVSLPLFGNDLTVGWISREPALEYVWGSTNPSAEGWPVAGSTVTWRAHVRNWTGNVMTMPYVWRANGVEIARGNVTLAANTYTTVDLARPWSFRREKLSFAIGDRTLEVFTDALAVGFWVEQSFYDYFRAHQHRLGIGSTSFEEWAQRTITYFNDMAALAVFPEAPHGALDRWRLQKIVIVPDDSLPLNGLPDDATPGATGATHPDQHDRTVDLMWGFPAWDLGRYTAPGPANPATLFYVGWYVLHEMGHARYLTDVYAWNVIPREPFYTIDIRENGVRILRNYIDDYRTPEQGLMNAQFTFLDRYSTIALNFISGARATHGNYNEPRNIASFINDLPAQNRLTVRDAEGVPIANADVWFYTSVTNGEAWYAFHYDNTPDLQLRTDEHGQVLVGRSPFAANGKVLHAYGMTNGVAIVRVAKEGKVAYGFLESRLFNLAYWRGQTDFADHDLYVGLQCSSQEPRLLAPEWGAQLASSDVLLQWQPSANAQRYHVWISNNLGTPRIVDTTTETQTTIRTGGRVDWWVEAELGPCGSRRTATRRFHAPPLPPRRRAAHH
jgi:hypothetical protein